MIYEGYKKGYSTLPNLKKITAEEVFEKDNSDSTNIMLEKVEALECQNYFAECNHDPKIYETCYEWIKTYYPRPLQGKNYLEVAKETEEDFLIHRLEQEKDWLSSAHVCFASHWKPEDKIGKNFDQIHQPVPMNLKNSKKLVDAMVHGGIFERFVWSVVYEEKYNYHPRFNHKSFNKDNPTVLLKVERQVTVGFSKENFCLFILRQYLIRERDIDKESLAKAIENMNEEQKRYKGLENSDDLILYLRS